MVTNFGSNAMGLPAGTFPYRWPAVAHITPFTYRDGVTYLELLEEYRQYLINLTPQFDKLLDDIVKALEEAIANAEKWAEDHYNDFTQHINDLVAEINNRVGPTDVKHFIVNGKTDLPFSDLWPNNHIIWYEATIGEEYDPQVVLPPNVTGSLPLPTEPDDTAKFALWPNGDGTFQLLTLDQVMVKVWNDRGAFRQSLDAYYARLSDLAAFKVDINKDFSQFKSDVNSQFSDFKSDVNNKVNGLIDSANSAATIDTFFNSVRVAAHPVMAREPGEGPYPQGFSLDLDADRLYLSAQSGTHLQIREYQASTGNRLRTDTITTTDGSFTESLYWWKNSSGQRCFFVRTRGTGLDIYNWDTKTVTKMRDDVYGSTRIGIVGNQVIATNADSQFVSFARAYSFSELKNGNVEVYRSWYFKDAGEIYAKTQGIAWAKDKVIFTGGSQEQSLFATIYNQSGGFVSSYQYNNKDIMSAVNKDYPGTFVNSDGTDFSEGEGNYVTEDGRIFVGYVLANRSGESKFIVLEHNRIDGHQLSTRVTPMPDGWHLVTLEPGWTNLEGNPVMSRTYAGRVEFKGVAQNENFQSTDYVKIGHSYYTTARPGHQIRWGALAGSTIGGGVLNYRSLGAEPNGDIVGLAYNATTAFYRFDGLSYALDPDRIND